MKIFTFLILLLLSGLCPINAQQFTRISDGEIVNTPGDSRSVNFIDVNNDGLDDIFFSNGPSNGQNNELYINNGNGSFSKITADPIVMDMGKSDGATFADSDNDGNIDAFVVTWYGEKNYYYRSDGSGSFTYEANALPGSASTYSETASWGDYDHDGLVDLYVTNSDGNKRNQLYHNLGDGVFEAVSSGSWVTDTDLSRSVNWVDFNNDGKLDLFVSNESNTANDLYQNDGQGGFTKVSSGAIVQTARSSMSSSWADVNNDGYLDLFVSNAGYFQEQNNQLFINQGDGTFELITTGPLAEDGGCSYGSAFADYDNDGDVDLLVANGFCNSNLQDFLYRNDGQGNFERDLGSMADMPDRCSFGAAWGDYNDDGFLDLAVAHCKNNSAAAQPENTLLLNNGNDNHWLKVKLSGVMSNHSAIGAVLRVKATIGGQEVWQMRELSAQSGYCGQNSLTQHFGLGDATTADSLIIQWPSGLQAGFEELNTDTTYQFVEDISDAVNYIPAQRIHLEISPNPTRQYLEINARLDKFTASDDFIFSVTDSLGKKWKTLRNQLSPDGKIHERLDLGGLPAGTYFLMLRTAEYISTKSFIVH